MYLLFNLDEAGIFYNFIIFFLLKWCSFYVIKYPSIPISFRWNYEPPGSYYNLRSTISRLFYYYYTSMLRKKKIMMSFNRDISSAALFDRGRDISVWFSLVLCYVSSFIH